MKQRLLILIALILMAIGATMVYIPWYARYQQDYKMAQLKEAFLDMQQNLSGERVTERKPFKLKYNTPANELEKAVLLQRHFSNHNHERALSKEETNHVSSHWQVDGLLNIKKIDLSLPIISGASRLHLDISPASVTGTPKPWEGGNYVIAGHRSTVRGRHFNRLGELEKQDKIIFIDSDKVPYTYSVYDKYIVHESEISLLNNTKETQLTLITCDPLGVKNPDTRLIIKAKRTNLE